MAFYAYCLIRLSSDEPWPVLQGIDEHPVFALRSGKYSMLLSRLERSFPFTPRSIVEHGQVIARVFETHTVLPMRFGTFFKSEKQITNLIQENQKELLEAFCRLRGKAEMRLKLLFQPDASERKADKKPPRSMYLPTKVWPDSEGTPLDPLDHQLARESAARLGEMFRPLEQQMSCRMITNQGLLVDCAHLIESQKVERYQKLHSLASEQVKECDIRISGPWPPYHFLPSAVRMPAATAAVPLRRRAVAGSR